MSEFKLRVSDVIVDGRSVRCVLFVAPTKDQTFQRCGELTLTQEEARELQSLLSPAEVSKFGHLDEVEMEVRPLNEHGFPIYLKGTPVTEVREHDRGQKLVFHCKEHPDAVWASKDPLVSNWFGSHFKEVCSHGYELETYVLAEDYSPTRNG